MHELSAHNSKDCNRDHETIAQYRKAAPEHVKTTGKMITFVNGIQKKLPPLSFGSFFQLRYQSIEEAGKDRISDGDIHLETVKADRTNVVRRLQFSEGGTSAQPIPSVVDVVQGNRSAQMAHNSKDCNRGHETIARYRKAAPEHVKTTGKMITSVNGIQKKLPPLTFGSFLPLRYQSIEEAGKDYISDGDIHLETVKADRTNVPDNSKDCNRDHETIARYRKAAPEHVKTTGKMITSVNGIQKKLPPLTFGSFLPLRYQSIEEAGKDYISDSDIHLETVKADRTNVVR
ncbi:hypothetical protein K7X08_034126 [Anisodus acutangulus]|uniref:Uncharacterized protein n=1 Tax=Anisodus acutangulus TaxID=402998 RepID=A0A9Q1L988_9SOLA|nr:hypothetical protein K7X08_034126 [Anisodus acutangulus]